VLPFLTGEQNRHQVLHLCILQQQEHRLACVLAEHLFTGLLENLAQVLSIVVVDLLQVLLLDCVL